MADYLEGVKRDVAEIKFLIHDLRVERLINEVIHHHATLDMDLEIYGVDQAQVLHEVDLQELKDRAVRLRKALGDYSNAVKSYSPERTVLRLGRKYVETVYELSQLILSSRWGRFDRLIAFLPEESHSVGSHQGYRDCIDWIRGVHSRIEHFLEEQEGRDLREEFDLSQDVRELADEVLRGYVAERSGGRVQLRFGALDPVAIGGNRHRFRRMVFNLVMNAVDALSEEASGAIDLSVTAGAECARLRVSDDGRGMSGDKIERLLAEKETLDGELHSLGFVFVRQTIDQLGGRLSIESEAGRGTVVEIRLPFEGAPAVEPPAPLPHERCEPAHEASARAGDG